MATSFSGRRRRSTRREPPTMGTQLVNLITCDCKLNAPFLVHLCELKILLKVALNTINQLIYSYLTGLSPHNHFVLVSSQYLDLYHDNLCSGSVLWKLFSRGDIHHRFKEFIHVQLNLKCTSISIIYQWHSEILMGLVLSFLSNKYLEIHVAVIITSL
jgi:hypothetical protein